MSRSIYAWDVYAQQLQHLGRGLALWNPEPDRRDGEVQIGDIGFMTDGRFNRLFNATVEPGHPHQTTYGLPADFEPFSLEGYRPGEDAMNENTKLSSRSMKELEVTVDAGVPANPAGVSTSLAFKFKCTSEQGAVLVLKQGARKVQKTTRRARNYFSKNFGSFYAFATGPMDLEIDKEDLMFVCGHWKTSEWAVASYTQGGSEGTFSLTGGGNALSAGISVCKVDKASTPPQYNWGPKDMFEAATARNTSNTPSQCVFLIYYKMKYRLPWWPTLMRAGAGDHVFDPERDNNQENGPAGVSGESSHSMETERIPALQKPYDPVNFVLDYILRHSDANVAIASSDDVVNACRSREVEIPDDIEGFLEETRPAIETNEDGLGMLFYEDLPIEESTSRDHVPAIALQDNASMGSEEQGAKSVRGDESDDHNNSHGHGLPATINDNAGSVENLKNQTMTILDSYAGVITALAYSPNGRFIASGTEAGFIKIWDANGGLLLQTCEGHTKSVSYLAFSPDCRQLLSGSDDGLAIVWSVATGEERFTLRGHDNALYGVAYSPDGSIIATTSVDATIRLWDAYTGESTHVFGHTNTMMILLAFSPNGQRLATAGSDFSAYVWDVQTGAQVAALTGHYSVMFDLAFSPDSRRLVISSDDRTARVWNVETGELLITQSQHTDAVWAAAFTRDGKNIISIAKDGAVKVWDSYGGEIWMSLETCESSMDTVAISSDAARVCTSPGNSIIQVWSTKTGQQLATLTDHEDAISYVKFSPDGNRVVSSCDDGLLRLFDLGRMGVRPGA